MHSTSVEGGRRSRTGVAPVPAEAQVLGVEGTEIGGLLLFLNEGLLSSLEVYSYDQHFPTVDTVRWSIIDR